MKTIPKGLSFFIYINGSNDIVYFSGFYLKDLWLLIQLLWFWYITLFSINIDQDSPMISSKFAFNLWAFGILLVYFAHQKHFFLNILSVDNTIWYYLYCKKFFEIVPIVFICFTFCKYALNTLMKILIRVFRNQWVNRYYNFIEYFFVV